MLVGALGNVVVVVVAMAVVIAPVAIVAVAIGLIFCMIYVIPGDPVKVALGPRATPDMVAHFARPFETFVEPRVAPARIAARISRDAGH